jgi:hypothetical protein
MGKLSVQSVGAAVPAAPAVVVATAEAAGSRPGSGGSGGATPSATATSSVGSCSEHAGGLASGAAPRNWVVFGKQRWEAAN